MALADGAGESARPVALAYRALGLGDLLTAVPALRGLRAALPGHRLVLASTGAVAPLGGLIDGVDATLVVTELAPLPWAGRPPAVAVNLHGHGPQSNAVLAALRPGRLVAYDPASWPDGCHEVRRWCRLVEEAFPGVRCDAAALDVARPPVPSRAPGAVVVHPGAAYGSRRWPAERFGAVAGALAAAGRRVVVTGSAAERPLAERVAGAAGLGADAVLAGATDVLDLAALVADAALVVCGDTGVGHLATAYGTPSVVLFGPTPPSVWGPPARPQHVALFRRDPRAGDPWAAAPDPGLLAVTVEEVLEAAARVAPRV